LLLDVLARTVENVTGVPACDLPAGALDSAKNFRLEGERDMRFVLCILLLAIRTGQASEPSKGWSDWLSGGKALRDTGNYSAAACAFREALAIAARSDIDERQLVVLHDALAGVYAEAGQFAESEAEYRCALALVEKGEGQGSLHYAVLLGEIAILPAKSCNPKEVIALLRQAIEANVQVGSARDMTVARECLAQILRSEKRYQEAEPLLLDALADLTSQKAADPASMAAALNNLAVLRFDQERYAESVDLQQRSIRAWEMALGKEHPSLVAPLNNLATTYVKMAHFEDAERTFEGAIKICSKTLGEDHLDFAVLLNNYAVVLRTLGRKREAKKFKAQAQQIERETDRRNGVSPTISVTALRSDPPLTLQP
jgi:tetratricopeptide (TPR) repeat protein